MLARIPKRTPVILTHSKKEPWAPGSLTNAFDRAKEEAWPKGGNLHFHDLRGTAATKFYLAGLTAREIAEIMAWEENTVERIIRRYIGHALRSRRRSAGSMRPDREHRL
nr:tyrosine-type recombinase/integrase [Mesorhizobium sp. B2-4-12]